MRAGALAVCRRVTWSVKAPGKPVKQARCVLAHGPTGARQDSRSGARAIAVKHPQHLGVRGLRQYAVSPIPLWRRVQAQGVLRPCAYLKITAYSAAYTRYIICNLDTHFAPLRVASLRPQTSSDLKSAALFLLPLRGALLLQRLGRLLLRFLLPVHTLAHGSPPRDGERGDLKPTGQPWRLRLQIAMPELYLRGDGCGTGMTSAGNAWCRNRRVSRRCSQAGDAAAQAAAFRLKRRNNQFVIEIDPHTHAIVWQFGNGSDKAGPRSIVGTNDAERFRAPHADLGNGIPPASPPLLGCSEQQSHRRGQCRGRTPCENISPTPNSAATPLRCRRARSAWPTATPAQHARQRLQPPQWPL